MPQRNSGPTSEGEPIILPIRPSVPIVIERYIKTIGSERIEVRVHAGDPRGACRDCPACDALPRGDGRFVCISAQARSARSTLTR